MADFIPDDVLCNIIARLPAKPLLRCRCLSKYWNHMLTQPNFMKLRSLKRCHPYANGNGQIKVIGTLNGIVVVRFYANAFNLYNPFTCVSKYPSPPFYYKKVAYGFGYGPTPDDLKIIRFRQSDTDFDVYTFRENSWSSLSTSKYNTWIKFEQEVGHFINGSLYWIACCRNVLIAVSVKDLVHLEICLPFKINRGWYLNPLATINRCLCSLNQITASKFNMWVMKEHDQWSKIYSFELPLNEIPYHALRILDGRRILMVDPSKNLIIYDTLKKSYKTFNISMKGVHLWGVHAFEYVESLISPLDMCSSRLEQRRYEKQKNGNWKVKRIYVFMSKKERERTHYIA
ncbi:putative F-box domain, leucine-rich repeat domain superfamily, F-box-like domain superfamily [Helianthus anomalus]